MNKKLSTPLTQPLFGTDGVRGRANIFPMTVEIALALGKATAKILRRKGNGKCRVVVGKDTRLSGYMFENALIAGLCSMGVDTLMVGPLPTPGVAFITRAYRADAGIVISASHNSYQDNGIKIFNSDGFKMPDALEQEMQELVFHHNFINDLPHDSLVGRNKRIHDADGRYIEFIKATFPKGKTLKGFKVVLDCANGAAHRVAPLAFQELDAETIVYANRPDGLNINANCGTLALKNLQKKVLEHKADLGIALDGDGDRVILVDENGCVVDGDMILSLAASQMKKRNLLKNNRVVATVMTNFAVINFLKSLGIEVFLSKVGDRYVIQEMLSQKAFLGGEQSGHLIFLDHNTTGDGIVSGLQILKIMQEEKKSLSSLASCVKKCPQVLLNIAVRSKPPLEEISSLQEAIIQMQKLLGEVGRVLVRYSGTENLCRVMVEGPKKKTIEAMASNLGLIIKKELGD